MKINPSLLLFAALSAAAIVFAGCAKKDTAAQAVQDTKAATKKVASDVKIAATDSWDNIKDYTYEKRGDFADSLERMGKTFDAELTAMNAKLKGLPEATAKTHNAAVKEFDEASAAFKVQLTALRASTAETWEASKKSTAAAWKKVQTSFDKIKNNAAS